MEPVPHRPRFIIEAMTVPTPATSRMVALPRGGATPTALGDAGSELVDEARKVRVEVGWPAVADIIEAPPPASGELCLVGSERNIRWAFEHEPETYVGMRL